MSIFMYYNLIAYSIAVLKIHRIVIICWICRRMAGNSRLPTESASARSRESPDSHVSLHNSLVEMLKCKHKAAFAGG